MILSTITGDLSASASMSSDLIADWYIMILVKILEVFFLVALNAFFIAAEFSIVKDRNSKFRLKDDAEDRRA